MGEVATTKAAIPFAFYSLLHSSPLGVGPYFLGFRQQLTTAGPTLELPQKYLSVELNLAIVLSAHFGAVHCFCPLRSTELWDSRQGLTDMVSLHSGLTFRHLSHLQLLLQY
jgi:hypothetical protein